MTDNWRGGINQLLYGLNFAREITDDMVGRVADSVVLYRGFSGGPEAYCRAINTALASGEDLRLPNQLPQFGRDQIEAFLRAVVNRLDEMRPWPEPAFRSLVVSARDTMHGAVPIARLLAPMVRVRAVLREHFVPVGHAEPRDQLMMLRLGTGETIGLLGSLTHDDSVTLLAESTAEPGVVIDHFIAATGFPADDVRRVDAKP